MAGTLGDLLARAGLPSSAPAPEPASAAVNPAPAPVSFGKKVTVRASRKGHGGKTVTQILGVTGGQDLLITQLKAGFGVGVRQEGDAIVLQGDQVARLAPWLEKAGARVVKG